MAQLTQGFCTLTSVWTAPNLYVKGLTFRPITDTAVCFVTFKWLSFVQPINQLHRAKPLFKI